MNDTLANSVFVVLYIFGVIPIIGEFFGGNYRTYGKDDAYSNRMYRGLFVHIIAAVIVIVLWAIYHKIFN